MADKKDAKGGKPAAKPAPAPGFFDSGEGFFLMVLGVIAMIVLIVIPTVMIFFGYSGEFDFIPDNLLHRLNVLFSGFVDTVGFIGIFISLLIWMINQYLAVQTEEIVEKYEAVIEQLNTINKRQIQGGVFTVLGKTAPNIAAVSGGQNPLNLPGASADGSNGAAALVGADEGNKLQFLAERAPQNNAPKNPKWLEIERHMQSHAASDWKVAILEADILLFDMLQQMGYEGDSIGEILKKVDRANFVTIDDAWKAHRVRNIIAHEGTNYELERSEAERTIRLFKRVFDEFYFI